MANKTKVSAAVVVRVEADWVVVEDFGSDNVAARERTLEMCLKFRETNPCPAELPYWTRETSDNVSRSIPHEHAEFLCGERFMAPPPGSWAETAAMCAAGDDSGFDWDAWKDEMKERDMEAY